MKTLISSFALAGLMTAVMAVPSMSQERTMRRMTAGEPAAIQKAMTQKQARKVCADQMRGARESKAAIRTKMRQCVIQQTQGN